MAGSGSAVVAGTGRARAMDGAGRARSPLPVTLLGGMTGSDGSLRDVASALAAEGAIDLQAHRLSTVDEVLRLMHPSSPHDRGLTVVDATALGAPAGFNAAAARLTAGSGAPFLVMGAAQASSTDLTLHAADPAGRTLWRRGLSAGLQTATGKIGLVGNFAVPETLRLFDRFQQGVTATRPDAAFVVGFCCSETMDAAAVRIVASSLEAQGADIILVPSRSVAQARGSTPALVGYDDPLVLDAAARRDHAALWRMEPAIRRLVSLVGGRRAAV